MGHMAGSRVGGSRASRRSCRQARYRARLRNRVRIRVVASARRTRRRNRQLASAARDRPTTPAVTRSRLSAHSWQRGERPISRCELRFRHLGVRRLSVGGSGAMGSRSIAPSPRRWSVGFPDALILADAVRARGGGPSRNRSVAASGFWDEPHRMARRSGRRVSPLTWRLDTAPAPFGLRDRGPDRAPPCGGSNDAFSFRHSRVGASVAERGDLESPQAALKRHLFESLTLPGPERTREDQSLYPAVH